MNRLITGIVTGALAAALLSPGSLAQSQRKKTPPPPPEAPRGPVIKRITEAQEFLDAYQRAGRPRWLIFTDMLSMSGPQGKKLNDKATANSFSGRIQSRFQLPDVRFVNLFASDIAKAQTIRRLETNDVGAAARVLAESVDVDVMLYIQMIETTFRDDDVYYAASYVVVDFRTGDQLARYSWDMRPAEGRLDFDAIRMDKYAAVVADRVAREFIEQFPRAGEFMPRPREATQGVRRYTVNFSGLLTDEDAIFEFVMAARDMRAMRQFDLRSEKQDSGVTIMEYDALYADELIRLRHDLKRIASDQFAMDVDVISTVAGQLDVVLLPRKVSTLESLLSGDNENRDNREIRRRLNQTYIDQAEPVVAVMINQAMQDYMLDQEEPENDQDELSEPAHEPEAPTTPASTVIYLSPRIVVGGDYAEGDDNPGRDRPRASENPARREDKDLDAIMPDDLLDTLEMENNVSSRLVKLGINVVDLSQAQAALFKDAELAELQQIGSGELAFLLGKQAGAQVVISGVGRVDRRFGRPVGVRYTFRAYQVDDGQVLGAASVQSPVDFSGARQLASITDALAAEAVGKLMVQMLRSWEPPSEVEVLLSNVSSIADLYAMMNAFEQTLSTGADGDPLLLSKTFLSFTPGTQDGLGRYIIKYAGSYEDLVSQILRAIEQDDLPFDFDTTAADRERLRLRIK